MLCACLYCTCITQIWSLELAHSADSSKSEPPQEKVSFLNAVLSTCVVLGWIPSYHNPVPCARAIFLQCEFDHDSTVTCLDLDSASMRVVSGTKDGKSLLPPSLLLSAPVRYVVYMYMYVLINSGFVTVWSIENESRDYELQGKDFAKKLLSSINMYHAFFFYLLSAHDTVHAVLFSPGMD